MNVKRLACLSSTAFLFCSGCAYDAGSGSLSLANPLTSPTFAPAPKVKVFDFKPEDVKLLAVVSEDNKEGRKSRFEEESDSADRAVDQEFVQAFLEKGYPVVARGKVSAALKEIGFQTSGVTAHSADVDVSSKLKDLLKVSHILVWSGNAQGDMEQRPSMNGRRTRVIAFKGTMQAQLIDLETGRVMAACSDALSKDGSGIGDGIELARKMAKRIASGFPTRAQAAR